MTGWRRPWVIDGAMNSEIFTLYAEMNRTGFAGGSNS